MDRTREFSLFIEATSAPQREKRQEQTLSSALVASIEEDLGLIERQVSKKEISKEIVKRIENNLKELAREESTREITDDAFREMVRAAVMRKYAALTLRLTKTLREEQKRKMAVQMEEEAKRSREAERAREVGHTRRTEPGESSAYLAKEKVEIEREESSTLRKRELETIETHINELGRMVTEVSMHISMQGERLQRVDEIFTRSRISIKKGTFELNHLLYRVMEKRRRILIAFGVLFAFLLLRAFFK